MVDGKLQCGGDQPCECDDCNDYTRDFCFLVKNRTLLTFQCKCFNIPITPGVENKVFNDFKDAVLQLESEEIIPDEDVLAFIPDKDALSQMTKNSRPNISYKTLSEIISILERAASDGRCYIEIPIEYDFYGCERIRDHYFKDYSTGCVIGKSCGSEDVSLLISWCD